MKKSLCICILLVSFLKVWAQTDSARIDSLVLPKVTLFTLPSFIYILSPEIPLQAGCEIRLRKHMTIGVSAGYVARGLFGSRYSDPFGYGFSVEPRYYFLKKNAAYLGLYIETGKHEESATLEFRDGNSIYNRRTRITREYIAFNPVFGWYGIVNPKIRFPIGIAFGLHCAFQNIYFSNLSQHQINLIKNKKTDGFYGSTRPFYLIVEIATPIGWVVKR